SVFASAPSASSSSAAAADLAAYSTRKGGSRNSLMSEYFAIIWRNSGLEASVQSMQRVAPWVSVKQTDQVWCSSSSTGLFTLNWNSSASSTNFECKSAILSGTPLPSFEEKSARCVSSAR